MTPQEIIASALDKMRGGHWTRGIRKTSYRAPANDPFVQYCALGAVGQAALNDVDFYELTEEHNNTPVGQALKLLARHVPADFKGQFYGDNYGAGGRIADYNNSRKDFTEIEQWFEKAAADDRIEI